METQIKEKKVDDGGVITSKTARGSPMDKEELTIEEIKELLKKGGLDGK